MDRGAALNCRVVHNWGQKKEQAKNNTQNSKNEENLEKTEK